jgi:hypothetical protein
VGRDLQVDESRRDLRSRAGDESDAMWQPIRARGKNINISIERWYPKFPERSIKEK